MKSLGYILPLIVWVFIQICVLGSIIMNRAWNDHSRSSKVIDFGANRKHVCDFLL